jgi:hypothetical protein
MVKKFKQLIGNTKHEIISAAEQKLGRALTLKERNGVESICSLNLLEACYQAFTSAMFTPAQVLADLNYLSRAASRTQPEFLG